jgi:hypothetical protein
VPRDSVKSGRGSGLALFVFAVPAVMESGVVAFVALGLPEAAEASPFGRGGTFAVCVVAAVLSVVGAVLAWRGVGRSLGSVLALLLGVAAGLVALIAFVFLFSGSVVLVLAVLLIHAAFSIAMIARAVARATSMSARR